jgi:hypothetical protein
VVWTGACVAVGTTEPRVVWIGACGGIGITNVLDGELALVMVTASKGQIRV